ncbi:MAG: LysM peptidoglycan-binding domain-containing protein [Bacilli bacterium]|nr:LysM peptidoglycan-binding domain-containing protein [Bacilli bacterium]
MKQVIPFKKEIVFKTMISKITSISLEHTLELKEFNIVSGDFIISGSYKMTEASQIDEDFSYKIPIEITVDGKYDTSNISLEIDDFTYEVVDEEKLSLSIDLCIDNLELKPALEKTETLFTSDEYEDFDKSLNEIEKELEQESLVREEDLFMETSTKKDLEIPVNINSFDDVSSVKKKDLNTNENMDNASDNCATSIFTAFKDTDETFSTYSIYIIREGDNLDTILNKYNTTKDILMEYNDLSDIRIGTKIIVPSCNE